MARRISNRVRRSARGTGVAAVTMAVLTASQAPGVVADVSPHHKAGPPTISGDSPYRTELPPLATPADTGSDRTRSASRDTGQAAVPATVLDAYRRAAATVAADDPQCNLGWELLAAIGQVESGHARGGRVDAGGRTLAPILGPRLDGNGFASIRDTDDGAYDGDTTYDRAVGPMQFIPSTWATWGADGNGDGHADPDNVYDAGLAAGRYLCAGARDLSDPDDLDRAVLGYNHSLSYLHTVKSWLAYFRDGYRAVPDAEGVRSSAEPEKKRDAERSRSTSPEPTPSASSAQPRPPSQNRDTATASPEPDESRETKGPDVPEVDASEVEKKMSRLGEDALSEVDDRRGDSGVALTD